MPKDEIEAKALAWLDEHCFGNCTEEGHIIADQILCSVLKELGYDELVTRYKKLPKWYA